MPNSKRKEFFKTLRNDFSEYGMQTLLLGLTAVITTLLSRRSSQERFIDILVNHIIPSDEFIPKLNTYILSAIIFFLILTILSTTLPILFNKIIKKEKQSTIINNTDNKTISDENPSKIDKLKKSHIKFGSHLIFKRTASTIANTGSVILLLAFFVTLLYWFPQFFNLNKEEIEEISNKDLVIFWVIASIYFFVSIFLKSISTVFIEEPIKRSKRKSSSQNLPNNKKTTPCEVSGTTPLEDVIRQLKLPNSKKQETIADLITHSFVWVNDEYEVKLKDPENLKIELILVPKQSDTNQPQNSVEKTKNIS